MAVNKKSSARRGSQAKKSTKRKATKSKSAKSKSASRAKRGRQAVRKTPGKRIQSSTPNAGSTRLPLSVLENLTPDEMRRLFRPRLPATDDPWEEPCLEADPMPEDYVFVPKGDVYITRYCKSHTKDRGMGIRIPKDAYDYVMGMAKRTAEYRAEAVRLRDERALKRARKVLQTQFPAMPEASLEAVLQHAFLKGSGRVGRSTTQTDENKAILAVEAHIRHTHTPYESLLEAGLDRNEARDAVRDTVQAIKDQWAGKSDSATTQATTVSTAKTGKKTRAKK
ncbi:hypothetical protein T310_6221 [Rasamsonia emersonii CBS 393.64]|uniref:DUF2293 domain-containing protein n=1 Tax=Rasamsonia emersonii (strain ATCC 16479 / CBS 393.64 / IMI 116815) TaxID=1408163 RepID=A0A0F4YPN1_RASE3|nr:hypothetical protein T310_6221 [Rasamsonia emersonii CBS 393.64]KKA19796.1 hypothetical protein T310_6221 [Rasamsonia emersonii CBS 393.64]